MNTAVTMITSEDSFSEQAAMGNLETSYPNAILNSTFLPTEFYEYHENNPLPIPNHVLIWVYTSPFILIPGTVGNLLILVIMGRKSFQKTTTSLYLSAMAVADTVVLYSGLLRFWIMYQFAYDIRTVSSIACKLATYLRYWSGQYSAWTVVAVTLERVIVVNFPHKVKVWLTRKQAAIILASMAIFLLALDLHFFWTHDIIYFPHNGGTLPLCNFHRHMSWFVVNIWPWVDLCTYSFFPFTVLILANVNILYRIALSKINSNQAHSVQEVIAAEAAMTITLVTVSLVFIVTTCPVSMVLALQFTWFGKDAQPSIDIDTLWAVASLLAFTNNSLNFWLYCVTGPKFRNELKNLFCKKASTYVTSGQYTNGTIMSESPSSRSANFNPKFNATTHRNAPGSRM